MTLIYIIQQSGKSTLVNILSGSDSVPTYSRSKPTPGFSTTSHPLRVSITIDGHAVDIIDTPAIMRQLDNGDKDKEDGVSRRTRDMLLRNRGQVDRVKDPLPASEHISTVVYL